MEPRRIAQHITAGVILFSGLQLFRPIQAQPTRETVVPFLKQGHLIVLPVTLGGDGPFRFALDTGSNHAVISKRLGRRLGLKGKKIRVAAWGASVEVEEITLPSMEVAGLEFPDLRARICQLPGVEGPALDGLLGLEMLRHTRLMIDFDRQNVIFSPRRHLEQGRSFYPGLPFVALTLTMDGRAYQFKLDTGAPGPTLYREALEPDCPIQRTGKEERRPRAGGTERLEQILLPDLTIGKLRWLDLPAYLIDGRSRTDQLVGNLGIDSLGLKQLELDFEKGWIGFEVSETELVLTGR